MKRLLTMLLIGLFALISLSCSKKSTEEPKPTIPTFDTRTNHLTDWDKSQSRSFMTLWQFKYYKPDTKAHKFIGFIRSENGKGQPFNVVENSVGRKDVFVYFQFILNFEVANEQVATKLRDEMGANHEIKQFVWACAKNTANKNFDKERDLQHLNHIIVNGIMTKLRNIFKAELSAGTIHFKDDYTKNPLMVVDKNFRK